MRKGCLLTLGIVLGFVAGGAYCVYSHFKNKYDPVYYGKRIHSWADRAIWNEDPATRQEAVRILLEAVEEMECEPRTQLLRAFVGPTQGNQEKATLPQELLPFLIQALKTERRSGYPVKALLRVEGSDTVPALIDVLRNDKGREAREQAALALGILGSENKLGLAKEQTITALQEAMQDENPEVRNRAGEGLKRIEARK
jgi:hypothetical protein